MPRSFQDIVEAMEEFIDEAGLNLDTSEGEPIHDVVIRAPASEIAKLNEEIRFVGESQSIITATDEGLTLIGDNVDIAQRQAHRARVTVTFFLREEPTSDVVIPAGTRVSTRPGDASIGIEFVTTQTVRMIAGLAISYYNADLDVYEIQADAEAATPGIRSNVGPRTITTVVSNVTIDGVYNESAARDGRDIETLSMFRNRLANRMRGTALGTADGLLTEVLRIADVDDARVIGHGETDRETAGAVDILIKGVRVANREDVFTTAEEEFDNLILRRQPVLDDGVEMVISAGEGVLPQEDWSLVRDTGSFGGSTRAFDKIQWENDPPTSEDDGSIVVRYRYNSLVSDLQRMFADENRNLLNTDILVKWAFEIPIDIEMDIKMRAGFDEEVTTDTVSNAISAFLDTLLIGENIRQADLVRIILNTPGVRDVLLPFSVFQSSDGEIQPNEFNNLEIPANSYVVVGDIIINVVN